MVALIRRSPDRVYALSPFFRRFSLVDEVEAMARSAFEAGLTPKMDMYEEDGTVVVKAEMPGVSKKDLDIKIEDNVLTIAAEKHEEKEEGEEGKTHYTRERSFGRYVRTMRLPKKVDAEKVTATLKKGLLEIHLPEAETPERKQIDITVK